VWCGVKESGWGKQPQRGRLPSALRFVRRAEDEATRRRPAGDQIKGELAALLSSVPWIDFFLIPLSVLGDLAPLFSLHVLSSRFALSVSPQLPFRRSRSRRCQKQKHLNLIAPSLCSYKFSRFRSKCRRHNHVPFFLVSSCDHEQLVQLEATERRE
jgi:hypothetical protein